MAVGQLSICAAFGLCLPRHTFLGCKWCECRMWQGLLVHEELGGEDVGEVAAAEQNLAAVEGTHDLLVSEVGAPVGRLQT